MHSQSALPTEQYDTVDFGAFLAALKRRAPTIVLCTLLAATVALFHVLFVTPQFTAQGTLYLGETQGNEGGDTSGSLNLSAYSTESDVETQIGLLTSGTLIARAIMETGLNTTLSPARQPPWTYWRWRAFAHGDTAVWVPGPSTLQVVDADLPGKYTVVIGQNNTYRLYPSGKASHGKAPILTGVIGQRAAVGPYAITIQYATPTDPTETGEIQAVHPPANHAGEIYELDITSPDLLADALSNGMLSVTAGGSPEQPTKLATLQLKWPDPYQAQQFVNALMYGYISTQLQWKTEAASVTENFVTGQIADVSKKLAQSDAALSAFQAQTSIVDPQQNAQEAVERMGQLQSQRGTQLLQREALQQLNDSITQNNGVANPYLISQTDISQTNDTVLSGLASSLSEALVKLSQASASYTPNSQVVTVQESQVEQLRTAIRALIKNDLAQSTKNLADLDRLIASTQAELKAQPAEALKVAELKHTSDQLGDFYGLLTEKAEQAQISKAATIIDTRVVAPARLPHKPTSPNPKMTVIVGAMAGIFGGTIVVFLRHTLSGRFESEEQIRRTVRLPVYGAVPSQKGIGTGNKFFGDEAPNSFSESFRLIKRNLSQYGHEHKATILLVISANEGDGKTTVAANLAKAFTDDGKRAVMLDCDLYLSRLNQAGEPAGIIGSDGRPEEDEPELQRWPGEDFWLIPANALPTRSGRLNEAEFSNLIDRLVNKFDYLIMDAPPLPVASDGLALGRLADVILSVVSVRKTERRSFEYHNELIAALGRPHGLIINGAIGATYAETDAYFRTKPTKRKRFAGWLRDKMFTMPKAVAADE